MSGCYLCDPPVPDNGTDDWHEACRDCDRRLFWTPLLGGGDGDEWLPVDCG